MDAIHGFVVKSCYTGLTVQYSHGVSIYFPWAKIPTELNAYQKLLFARESLGAASLKAYLRETKRPPAARVENQERNFRITY